MFSIWLCSHIWFPHTHKMLVKMKTFSSSHHPAEKAQVFTTEKFTFGFELSSIVLQPGTRIVTCPLGFTLSCHSRICATVPRPDQRVCYLCAAVVHCPFSLLKPTPILPTHPQVSEQKGFARCHGS